MDKYKVIDLFAGAGGLSYGFLQTGKFQVVAAAEINENARATYKTNIWQIANILKRTPGSVSTHLKKFGY